MQKAFDKIQQFHDIIIQLLIKNRRKLFQHNEDHLWKIHSKHYTQWWRTENFFSKVRDKKNDANLQHFYSIW